MYSRARRARSPRGKVHKWLSTTIRVAAGMIPTRYTIPLGDIVVPARPDRTDTIHTLIACKDQPEHVKRCFVGFFGMNRSLGWTYPSIDAHVLQPLRESGYDMHLAGHFNCPDTIVNPRSREDGVPLDMSSVHLLGLDMQWHERQVNNSIELLLPHVLSVPYRGFKDTDGHSRKNAMHQLHSLRQLWRMLTLVDRGQFELYCLLRPDLEYLDPIPVAKIAGAIATGTDVITPSWHRWGGLNDRFAFCSRKGADEYMLRMRHVSDFCQRRQYFHSEKFLAYVIRQGGLSTSFLATRARRIRATGEVWQENFAK